MYSAAIRTCCNIFLFAELVACVIYLVSGPFCGSYILISLERIYVVLKFEEALCVACIASRCLFALPLSGFHTTHLPAGMLDPAMEQENRECSHGAGRPGRGRKHIIFI